WGLGGAGRACRLMRTTGQKYEDRSTLRHVVPDTSRLASVESAVMERLPTKSWTCWAPFLMPGWATGLSGLSFRLRLVPQLTVNVPVVPPCSTGGVTTFGATSWMRTNADSGAASARACPPRWPERTPTATAPITASTTSPTLTRNLLDRVASAPCLIANP